MCETCGRKGADRGYRKNARKTQIAFLSAAVVRHTSHAARGRRHDDSDIRCHTFRSDGSATRVEQYAARKPNGYRASNASDASTITARATILGAATWATTQNAKWSKNASTQGAQKLVGPKGNIVS